MKKFIAMFLSFAMLILLSSCGDNNEKISETTDYQGTTSDLAVNDEPITEIVTEIVTNEEGETEIVTEIVEIELVEDETKKVNAKDETTTKKNTTTISNDLSKWSEEKVIEYYKKSCLKSSKVVSTQTMVMRKDSMKCDGLSDGILSFAEAIIRGVMKLNKVDTEGITGGHQSLTVNDVKSAKAYKSGNYTVIEMTMKDQTDGLYGDTYSGTVGHAISVVGGVAMVAEQFSSWDVNFDTADIKIHYTNAKLKVKINSNGVIEKGTWSYITTPVINGLKIEGLDINNAGCVIDYAVTVGGGF